VPDLLLAPYLPLSAQAEVGPWTLVPFGLLEQSGVVPDELWPAVRRLVEAYRISSGASGAMGAVAAPAAGQVGTPFERAAVRQLGSALLAGVLAGNPSLAVPEEEQDPNAGFAAASAENALLYGHPLGEGDSYVIETGVIVRVTVVRHAMRDGSFMKIEPPVELPRPLFAVFDQELASAVHALLIGEAATARVLQRMLDWYRIALSNAEAVPEQVRIGAARSALEILTGAGDETKRLVRAYGQLVRDDTTTTARYDEVFWAKGPVELTPAEWWMTRLCALRNAIVHGDEVPAELWEHEGHPQLNWVHDRLIAALRIFVATKAWDALLRLRSSERLLPRAAEQAAAFLRAARRPADDTATGA
jgi:hypothetical protein